MAKTAAQRQTKYRQARPLAGDNGERRLNTWVSTEASLALRRLARRYCVTQREMLERLVLAADQEILDTLRPDDAEWAQYFGVTA